MKQCTCYALRAIDCTCKPAKYGELYTSPTAKQEQGEPVAWGDVKLRPDGKRYCRAVATTDQSNLGYSPLYTTPQQRTWVELMRGVRVEGDTVVISVKGGNDAARELCGELIKEMNT